MLHVVRARDEVDRYRVLIPRDVQRGRLARDADELLEMRSRDLAYVEARENRVGKTDDPDPEAVPTRLGVVLDETARRQRAKLARDRAGG